MSRISPLLRDRAAFPGVTALAAALVWVSAAAAGDAVVKGTIEPLDRGLEGRARVQETVVRVVSETASPAPEAAEIRVEVTDGGFVPRVVAVPVGSRVEFVNRDEHIHNVLSRSGAQDFDLGMIAPGETGRVVLERAGVVRVICKAEPTMEAWVVAAPDSWFAVADAEGAWEIRGLPAGSHEIEAWNPHYETVRSPLVVHRDGEVIAADLRFTKRR